MKPLLPALALLATALSVSPAMAEGTADNTIAGGTVTGSLTLTTDYTFRGITQNDEKPAILGALTWMHDSGLHIDAFAAPVDFNNDSDASMELDGAIGYSHAFSDNLTGDITIWYYSYPGAKNDLNYNYFEGVSWLQYDFGYFAAKATLAYSPEYFGKTGEALYGELGLSAPIPFVEGLTVYGSFGRQDIDDNTAYGYPNWNNYKVGASYQLPANFTVSADYIDTSLKRSQCTDGCESRAVLSLTKSF